MNLQASTSHKSLATVDYANLLQPMGVDIGNGQLKLVTANGETRTESYVHYLTERSTDTVKGYVEYLDGDRSDTNLKSEQGRSKRMQGCNLDGDDAPKIICHLHRLNWYEVPRQQL